MNPLWMIDLSGKEALISEFYEEYRNAYKSNIKNKEENSEPWFYITNQADLKLPDNQNEISKSSINSCFNEIVESHAKRLTSKDENQENQERLIKYKRDDGTEPDILNIVFIGDIKEEYTTKYFHILSTHLRKELSDNKWTQIPNVFFYGLLYRPKNISISGNLKDRELVFLNQLHNLMQQKVASPFNALLFFESDSEQKQDMIKAMALCSLHISCSISSSDIVLKKYQDQEILNAGVSGIFFEHEVQKQREAFLLGHAILNEFVNNEKKEFYNPEITKNYVNELPVFKTDLFKPEKIIDDLLKNAAKLDIDLLECKPQVSPGGWGFIKIWNKYYNDFLPNLKRDLVNKTKYELSVVEEKIKDKLVENHNSWIKSKTKMIEEGIFNVFKSDNPQKNCSMAQAIEITNVCIDKVEEYKNNFTSTKNSLYPNEEIPVSGFKLIKKYENAYKAAMSSGNTHADMPDENTILKNLESQISNHPIFMLSMLFRAILIGTVLFFIGFPFLRFISPNYINLGFLTNNIYILGFVLFFIPLIIYYWKFRSYTKRLNSLKDQYVAVSIVKLSKRLKQNITSTVSSLYTSLSDFCEWIRDKRLEEGLRQNLGVLPAPNFSFKASDYFQPLLIDSMISGNRIKAIFKQDQDKENAGPIMSSGKFYNKEILKETPDLKVKLKSGDKKITELSDADKLELIKELMSEEAQIFHSIEESLDFSKTAYTNTNSKVLILDFSISMSGDPITELKNIVQDLKDKHNEKIRWVAFGNEAFIDTECGGVLPESDLGGTALEPAFQKVKEYSAEGELNFDKMLLISDGMPFDPDEAIRCAKEIGKPVDVIYIGYPQSAGETFMKEIAQETGGEQATVEKSSDVKVEVERNIETFLKVGDTGEFSFWELLKKGHIEGCAIALNSFASRKLKISEYSIEKLIHDYNNEEGLSQWFKKAKPTSALQNTGEAFDIKHFFKSSDIKPGESQDKLIKKISTEDFSFEKNKYPNAADILISILSVHRIKSVSELDWGNITDNNKIKISDNDPIYQVFKYYLAKDLKIKNFSGNEIESKS
jgi:hypothetical protein